VCFEESALSGGLLCEHKHLMCAACAAAYCTTFTERAKLLQNKGCVPCAHRGPNNQPCSAPPFTLNHLAALNNPLLLLNFMEGLRQQALEAAEAMPAAAHHGGGSGGAASALPAAVPAKVAAGAASSKSAAAAAPPPELSAAELSKQTLAALSRMQEECLFLACPRCGLWWDDYSGCSALQCQRPTCQQHFCGVCLFRSPNSQSCHQHVASAHGGHYHHQRFLEQHRPARTDKVVMFLLQLPNPLVRRKALQESKALLVQYGLQYDELFAMLGHDAPKPQQQQQQPVHAAGAGGAAAAVWPLPGPAAGFNAANAGEVLPLPPALANARVVLWLDRQVESNARLKASAAAAVFAGGGCVHVHSVSSGASAVQWLLDHPRLLLSADRFRIVSNHAWADNLTPAELRDRSACSPLLQLLLDTHSAVRLLLFCGASLPSATYFVAQMSAQHRLPPRQLRATSQDDEVLQFITFQA
jgi:hypothetical protein